MANFSYYTKLALELSREDCGRVVSIGNGQWTIVGILHRVDNEDIMELTSGYDWGGGGSRSIRCWVTVGPFKGEIDPRTQVTVEVPALDSGDSGDVIIGEILA
ncbi:hypothetical protein SEA_CHRISTIAN_24 [Arthrobacter phage Christian]|uniref:Uncharacterized protein n=2 Tax=Korravirus drrobert TaxID=1982078 RepID=A0A222ZG32_9CAUD|nr:hypothetical protein SEA_CHRISTIAN_24 [Arthrobacter phage Christian]AZS08684.1 hypothetical protein SEA_LENNOX_24 [Arthrobacter phage Lennox]WNM67602.1 hypothetical protein SEA_MAKOTO_24 [Arthrobacter phage Makoto]